ncbi:Txe/YoeB family addiction module toxin [uncultured Hymenobacter sp.]|uniref:Txe/YoeB family addiction module toxin n=1 Tax=uncultured Hymenobacter sp. TaxID=170016 RepID=UPI0035CADA9C
MLLSNISVGRNTIRLFLRKLNQLLRECQSDLFKGTGKPEVLKGNLAGCWSRRITQEHRLVYRVDSDNVYVGSCRFHYDEA